MTFWVKKEFWADWVARRKIKSTIKFRLKPIFFWNFKNVYFKTYKTFPQIFSQKSNRLSPQEKYLEWFWQAPYDARENSLNFIPFKLFESFKMFDSLKFSRKIFPLWRISMTRVTTWQTFQDFLKIFSFRRKTYSFMIILKFRYWRWKFLFFEYQ